MAITCGTVKLTVAVTVIVGGPAVEPFGHGQHAVAVAGAQRIHLRAHESRLAVGGGKLRYQFLGGAGDRDLHQRFGL
jgi:hypothetical protein